MPDNDLDAELLALAGDDDDSASDTEQTKPTSRVSKSPSPQPLSITVARKSRAPRAQKSASQKKASKSSRTGTTKQRTKDGSAEEGQASSPESLGSGAMSESESDTSQDALRDVDDSIMFPVDGKFISEKDKAEIMSMPELRREAILADRAQEAERRKQDMTLRQLREARQKAEAKAADLKKRKAGAADLEESPRKTTRAKVKATENLEAYKRQREQRNDQRRRNEESRKSGVQSPLHEHGSSDAEGDSENDVVWDEPKKAPPPRDEPQADLRDYERVRVGRTNFAKVCFYPKFDDYIKGCFCRVNIGADKATGQNVYRMTQIKGFKTGRTYMMEAPNGRPFHTDQYAIVAQGKAEKEWPFSACSDSRFTEAEFERYKRATTGDNLRTPALSFLTAKCNGIHELLNRPWTEEEISEKLKRAGILQDQSRLELRNKLEKDRERAIANDDEPAIARLDQELALLDGPKLEPSNSNGASRTLAAKPPSQQERLAALNRANRKANQEEIRKAQLAEKRREQKLHSAVARGEAVANPFARVKTRAKVNYDANEGGLKVPAKVMDDLFGEGSDLSRAGTPVPGTAKKNGTSTPLAGGQTTNGLGGFGKKKKMDDEILAAMDLGIDIDI